MIKDDLDNFYPTSRQDWRQWLEENLKAYGQK